MTKDHVLAIDCGTQSVRALIFDLRGGLIHKVRVPIEPYFSARPGWAEQHPTVFWDNLCAACQQLWQESPVPREALSGVALTAQRSTVVNVEMVPSSSECSTAENVPSPLPRNTTVPFVPCS